MIAQHSFEYTNYNNFYFMEVLLKFICSFFYKYCNASLLFSFDD